MTVRWGIIGCGNVCEVKSGPGFQKADGSELVAVMRRDGDLAADYARRHGVAKWYGDADALLHDDDVTAVYVATPVGCHMDYALRACRVGKPCYVEKPMARSYAECRRMIDAFAAAGLGLFVAYYRRGLDRFLQAKRLIDSGRVGTVTGVGYRFCQPRHRSVDRDNLPWRLVAEQSGGGIFLDLGSHTLDILDFILGPLTDVQGMAANVASDCDVEDNVVMQFRIPSGGQGTASWNFASDTEEDLIEIVGTDGRICLSTFGGEPVRLVRSGDEETFDLPNPPHVQQPLIQTIVDELLGRGECPSTGVSAARTARVMDRVLTGYYGGRGDEYWLRPETWPGRPTR
jgi:1,5-anhydro-D-fructose reductase (1,5-anhydro-D-mannitol-forming)